jgi:hypothetical protein
MGFIASTDDEEFLFLHDYTGIKANPPSSPALQNPPGTADDLIHHRRHGGTQIHPRGNIRRLDPDQVQMFREAAPQRGEAQDFLEPNLVFGELDVGI